MTEKRHNKEAVRTKGLTIEPPPKESGPESLYRVIYVIDINAEHVRQAAERAHEIMQDPESMRPVLHILDTQGHAVDVDLSDESTDDR